MWLLSVNFGNNNIVLENQKIGPYPHPGKCTTTCTAVHQLIMVNLETL